MNTTRIPTNAYFRGIDTNCYTCSQELHIPRSHCYDVEDAHFMGLTKNTFPDFTMYINKAFIYPIYWKEKTDVYSEYSLCSHKCARRFWHNWRGNESDSDSEFEESGCKRMKID